METTTIIETTRPKEVVEIDVVTRDSPTVTTIEEVKIDTKTIEIDPSVTEVVEDRPRVVSEIEVITLDRP